MFSVWLFVVLLCTYILWKRATCSRAHPLPPAYPGELPIIGHLHLLMTDTTKLWQIVQSATTESLRQGGVIYGKLGNICYVITDPEDALKVANTCLQKHFLYGFTRNWLGQGLLTSTGLNYHDHRKLVLPAFTASIVHSYLEVFNEQAKVLVKDIEPHVGKVEYDILPYFKEFTLRTTCFNIFGQSDFKGSTLFTKYLAAIEKIMKIIINRFQNVWQYNDFLYSLWLKKEEDRVAKTLNDVADGAIRKYREAINGATLEKSYKPILEHILQANDKHSLTDLEIRDELNTIIVGAFETTSNALICTLVLLGSHPEVQEKLHEEVIQVLGAQNDVDKHDLQKLVYTDAIIKESLRLFPALAVIGRCIDKDVELKNCTLRAGSDCFLIMYGINRHSSWGPDAEQFKPERWLDPTSLPENPNAFATFSFGKRSCIGKTYAMTSMKVALVHFVRKYRWTADITKLQCKFELTLQPATGHEITLQRRS